ncbi:class I SAM-dependent methyltransferase [Marivita sp. GX14005]|uniref:class I SAM-dependent methyltransferase n=1 Tax=Marivita sp. GX14005 TaxID=2942276 RepID=UPI0020186042|nr:class I SAM-dependent methyltransferase [Marivita sp. GX14005]MCL3882052.1 class I SAM-dependent methyltransferase [Marivita sp. GX14005]
MASPRLIHAVETGALDPASSARALLLEPAADAAFDAFGTHDLTAQQNFKPSYDALEAQGVTVVTHATDPADLVHVTVPRSRDLARGLIAQAARLAPQGRVIVDGAKTDGIDSLLREVKARVSIDAQLSKAHGRIFWFTPGDAFADWALPDPAAVEGGWITQPGVFSADGPDPGSQALVAALPKALKGKGADLGGGWGFLTAHLLDLPEVTHVDLVEADRRALTCAERNVTDPRAALHWADATTWGQARSLDFVVMNPPFHTSRTPDASLGQAFIRAAARLLKPKGQLVMVANRHLPYETTLAAHFAQHAELGGDTRFKILHAASPNATGAAPRRKRR